eukprot:1477373-Rhodomonas_salina.1
MRRSRRRAERGRREEGGGRRHEGGRSGEGEGGAEERWKERGGGSGRGGRREHAGAGRGQRRERERDRRGQEDSIARALSFPPSLPTVLSSCSLPLPDLLPSSTPPTSFFLHCCPLTRRHSQPRPAEPLFRRTIYTFFFLLPSACSVSP